MSEAIAAGRAREILVAPRTRGHVADVIAAAEAAGVPVRTRDSAREDHEQVAAAVDLPPELDERALATLDYTDDAIVVVLDGVTDPQNLGAAARSAEGAGSALLVSRVRRAAPVTPATVRASSGALLHLPHARVANIPRAIERLQEAGFSAVGLDDAAASSIYGAPPPEGRVALVVGDEERGLSRLVRERCDELRSLPMRGRVSSLNVSAALSAALYGFVLPARSSGGGR